MVCKLIIRSLNQENTNNKYVTLATIKANNKFFNTLTRCLITHVYIYLYILEVQQMDQFRLWQGLGFRISKSTHLKLIQYITTILSFCETKVLSHLSSCIYCSNLTHRNESMFQLSNRDFVDCDMHSCQQAIQTNTSIQWAI
jgi:hypothetical protein